MGTKALFFILAASMISACSGMRSVDIEKVALDEVVKPGERAIIVDKDDRKYDITVLQVNNEEISGMTRSQPARLVTVAADEIVRLETWGVDGKKTVLAAAGAVAGVAAFFAWLADGLSSMSHR